MAPKKGKSKEICWCKGYNGSSLRDRQVIAKRLGESFCPHACKDFFEKYTELLHRMQSFEDKDGGIQAHDGVFDFTQCSSLLTLDLLRVGGLQELTGLRTECRLQSLRINLCNDLRDASGFEHSVGLREMFLEDNKALKKVPDLQKLTGLQILKIEDCQMISEVRGLGSLRQLRELECSCLWNLSGLPSLSGLQHLHHLELRYCISLTSLEGVGDLPLLRHLNLRGCSSWVRLPDLSKCFNLEDLDISDTAMELGEEDIVMLSKLPRLRPVIAKSSFAGQIKLDVVKRRVLKETYAGFETDFVKEERDLETPPIKLILDYKF